MKNNLIDWESIMDRLQKAELLIADVANLVDSPETDRLSMHAKRIEGEIGILSQTARTRKRCQTEPGSRGVFRASA
jgi:hypothetical protein